jgi:hypothetical protein
VPGVNRVLWAAATATVALAVAGCGAGQIPGHGTPAANATTQAGSAPKPSAGAASTPAPGGSGTTVSGESATVGKATIPRAGVTKASKDGDYLCLTLGGDTGCSLEVIDIGATRRSGGSVSDPAPGQPNGWWWGSDPPSCGTGETAGPIARSTVVDKGFRKVGPKTAVYAQWQVNCQNADLDFDPRVWWLPTSKIAFREHSTADGAAAAVDRILAGVTFGS